MKVIRTFFSGEFFFALFILVGSFKGALGLPIDETLLLLIVTLIIALKRLYNNEFRLPKYQVLPILIFILIIFFVFFSLLYTPSTIYASEKIIRFTVIAAWCYFGVFSFFMRNNRLKNFY